MGQEWAGKGCVTDFGCLVNIGLFSLCFSHFELVVFIYLNMIYISYGLGLAVIYFLTIDRVDFKLI